MTCNCERPADQVDHRAASPVVVLVGNPNTGKTTLYNALTGERAKVGNYPGITVERRSARLRHRGDVPQPGPVDLVDLPGTYSLSARSPEEQIALHALLGLGGLPRPSAAIVVMDAGQLSRNLYLVVQLLELDIPLVVAVNMVDEVAANPPDIKKLAEQIGVPCVATSARSGLGLDELYGEIVRCLSRPARSRPKLDYPQELQRDADRVAEALPEAWQAGVAPRRALAFWALLSIGDDELTNIPDHLRAVCSAVRQESGHRDIDLEIVSTRYAWVDELLSRVGVTQAHPPKRHISERIDRVILHPVLGFGVFLMVMAIVFQALFAWSEPLIRLVEDVVSLIQSGLVTWLPAGWIRDLLVQGIVGGVGNVVAFLPQIALLFLFIGLLEDSGYMSRVAFLIDRVMRLLGLHGRAIVPVLSGFACAVPAILATRTLERQRDRLLTMLVVPLTTCSARLPVYTLVIGALFPHRLIWGWLPLQGTLMVGMYGFAMVLTLVAALVLGRTVVRGRRVPLILELPPYRIPQLGTTLKMVAERAGSFLREAGTIILVCTVALWALLAFPKPPPSTQGPPMHEVAVAAGPSSSTVPMRSQVHASSESASVRNHPTQSIENSLGARLGKALQPAIMPLGFDWRLGVGLIGAFAAREVFVSTMALVYGIDEDDASVPLRERISMDRRRDGTPRYSALTGMSLLAFFAIACQCTSTLAVVRRETRSWRWPAFLFAYTVTLAWLVSFAIYQGGRWLGLG